MPDPREITNVPDSDVGMVVQAFVDDGYTSITCRKVGDNNWTINGS